MKPLIRVTIILVLLISPSIGDASYLIQLKNGEEFITNRYWEEGNQIMFYSYGGVVGIQKDLVRKIEESNLSEKTGTDEQKATETRKMAGQEAGSENKEGNEKVAIKDYREKKLLLKRKFDEAWERYLEASKNKDIEAKEKAREEMTGFSKQIYDLADELKAKNKGVLPDWWEEKGK